MISLDLVLKRSKISSREYDTRASLSRRDGLEVLKKAP